MEWRWVLDRNLLVPRSATDQPCRFDSGLGESQCLKPNDMPLTTAADAILSDPLTALLRVIEVQCTSLESQTLNATEMTGSTLTRPALIWLLSDSPPLVISTSDSSRTMIAGDLVIAAASTPCRLTFQPFDSTSSLQLGASRITEQSARLLIAGLIFGRNDVDALVRLLPPFTHVGGAANLSTLTNMLSLLIHEATVEQIGRGAIADSIARTLFALALRHQTVESGDSALDLFQDSIEFGILGALLLMRNGLDK